MNSTVADKAKRYRPFVYAGFAYLVILQIGSLALNVPRALFGDGDFPHFYRPAYMIRAGAAHQLYVVSEQLRFERQLLPNRHQPMQIYFHPAFEALAVVPLTYLPYKAAYWVWSFAGAGALLGGARTLAPELGELSAATGLSIGAISVAFYPVANTILQGQDSLFLFALIALGYREFRRKREGRCGAALGLACFKFQYIAPLVFITGLVRWRPKLLGAAAGTVAALAGVSWLVVGNAGAAAYFHLLWHRRLEDSWTMPNLRGLIENLGGPALITLAVSAALAIWCGLRKTRSGAGEFSAATVAAGLVSYHSHVYDMAILLLPILLAAEYAIRAGAWRRLWLPGLFFVTPLYSLLRGERVYYLLALPMLAFFVVIPRWIDEAGPARAGGGGAG